MVEFHVVSTAGEKMRGYLWFTRAALDVKFATE
jgi:hypothetical protein